MRVRIWTGFVLILLLHEIRKEHHVGVAYNGMTDGFSVGSKVTNYEGTEIVRT
jgi:hypothetical protein